MTKMEGKKTKEENREKELKGNKKRKKERQKGEI